MIDVHTIGAGGGSIGWLDEGGLLHMGPQSAGAEPGPGLLRPRRHGADVHRRRPRARLPRSRLLPRRPDAAGPRAARGRRSSAGSRGPIGLDVVAAAAAMVEVIDLAMAARHEGRVDPAGLRPARAAARRRRRRRRGSRGRDRGGARHLDVIVPAPLLGAVRGRDAARRPPPRLLAQLPARWERFDAAEAARACWTGSSSRGWRRSSARASPRRAARVVAAADIRYVGQHHEVTVPFPLDDLAEPHRIERGVPSPARGAVRVRIPGQADARDRAPRDGARPAERRAREPAAAAGDGATARQSEMYLRSTARARAGRGSRRRPHWERARDRRARARGHGDDDDRRPRDLRLVFDASGSFVLHRRSGA